MAIFTVNSTDHSIAIFNPSQLSLREAIAAANTTAGEDTIIFDASLAGQTITLGNDGAAVDPDFSVTITDALTINGDINGDGVGDITITGAQADGSNTQLFLLNGAAADTTFNGLTLTGGNAFEGGAIRTDDADITVTNSTISGNTATSGGGIFNFEGDTTVTNSTISGNTAYNDGGGIFNLEGDTTVTNSTIIGNTATDDGGGISNRNGTNTVTNSTISGNTATEGGGGIYNYFGANTVTNSTISDNTATDNGGGIYNYFGENTVTSSTISGNTASDGGGIYSFNGANAVTNSLVVGNSASIGENDVSGLLTLTGGNIVGDTFSIDGTAETAGIAVGDIFAQTAEIDATGVFAGVLADNGGDVQTIALLANANNVALDASDATAPATDTTGADRFDVVGVANNGTNIADLGALELVAAEAGSLIVTTDADIVDAFDDETSLREAITLANTDADESTITFDAALDGATLRLTQGQLQITEALTIDGGGEIIITGDANGDDTLADGLTDVLASAANLSDNSRLFVLSGLDADTTFAGLTLTGGNGYSGGAIFTTQADITVTNSTIGGNTATFGGGIYNLQGATTVSNSTISGNTASTGGGIFSNEGATTVTNSTISGNAATTGGGIANFIGANTVTSSTISGNTAGNKGGGIYNQVGANALTNSLVVGNYAATSGNDVAGSQTLTGGNIVGDTFSVDGSGTTFGIAAGDVFAEVAEIDDTGVFAGVLADNGGDVQTIALLLSADNAAIDASNADAPATDARGRSRSDFPGVGLGALLDLGIADLGAFELFNDAPVFSTSASQSVAEGDADVVDLAATDALVTEGSGLTYSLEGGADAALFDVDASNGQVTFKDDPNFELALDSNGDNVYEITVGASDGGAETTLDLEIAVTNIDEAVTLTADPAGGTLTGSDDGDVLTGAFGDDVINAGLGDDTVLVAGGDNTVNAGGGDDRVGLASGTNVANGGAGGDLLVGGLDNDVLNGDSGNDVIIGDISDFIGGADTINGGTGNDLLEGGVGADVFVFGTGDGADTIGTLDVDFNTPSNTTASGADFVSGVDLIALEAGFGITTGADALSNVSDVAGVATFTDQGTTITFAGLTTSDLAADDFTFL